MERLHQPRYVLRAALITVLSCLSLDRAHGASIALDSGFVPPSFATPDYPARALLLPDGSYILFFNVNTLVDQPASAITHYFPDGTFDTAYNFPRSFDSVEAAASLPDGRLIASGNQVVYGFEELTEHIIRVNLDGSIDPTFNAADATTSGFANPLSFQSGVRTIVIQPDNKILLAGFFDAFGGQSFPGIVRLLPDGTVDPSFVPISLQFADGGIELGLWAKPAIQSDGKILIAGDFTGVNGTPDPGVARLNSDGTLDGTFNATGFIRFSPTRRIRGVVVQSDEKIIIGGSFNVNSNGVDVPLVRLNSDGSLDPTYIYPTQSGIFFRFTDLLIQPDDKPIGTSTSVYRFNTDGTLDSTFLNPVLLDSTPNDFAEGFSIGRQPDGRVLVGGVFSDVDDGDGIADNHWGVARFNSDGTLDTSLTTSHKVAERRVVTSFTRQFDDSTLVALELDGFNFEPALLHSFGRLLSNGSLDTNFDPVASFSSTGAFGPDFRFTGFNLLADGELLAFGQRDLVFGTGTFTYGKLFPDVTEDTSYVPGPNDGFSNVHALSDGRALVANYPSSAPQNVIDNTELQRLNTDGTVDSSFHLDPGILADTVQRDVGGTLLNIAGDGGKVLAVLDDGTILFSYLALDSTARLVRLTANGSIDPSFLVASTPVSTTATTFVVTDPITQLVVIVPGIAGSTSSTAGFSDGFALGSSQAIVVGGFSSYLGNPAHGIVKLLADGSVDTSFLSGGGAQWTQTSETTTFHPSIDNIELENDGKFLISGTFEAYDGVAAPGLATLNPDGSLFEGLSRIGSRAKFDNFLSRAVLVRQPDGSFYLGGPYIVAGGTEQPSFIHINSFGGVPIIGSPLIARGMGSVNFTYQIVASGQPISYSATGLPGGLSLDSQTGTIAGIPTAVGTFAVTLSATNGEGTGSATLQLTIAAAAAPPTITSSLTANATVGTPFSYQITATNVPFSFNATSLPAGLTVNTSTGLISGTPSGAGNSTVALSATNTAGTGTANLSLTITFSKPAITSPTTASGQAGQPFSYQITATNIPTSYNATGLPAGLTTNTTSGLISGTPAVPGTFPVTLSATNPAGTGTKTLTLTILNAIPVITSPLTATATVGQLFIYQIIATNSPTSYNASNLPAGLSIDPIQGIISGIVSQTGATEIGLSASNDGGTGTASLNLTTQPPPPSGISIISNTSATGRVGSFFEYQVFTTGASPTASITATGLPAGLTLDPMTGEITGTPTVAGSFSVTLTVTDGALVSTTTLELTFTGDPAFPVITSATSVTITTGQAFSYAITAPNSDPDDPVTFALIGTLPTGLTFDPATGTISGTYQGAFNHSASRPGPDLAGGYPITNVQLVATNSHGTATTQLIFFIVPQGARNISTRLAVETGDDVLIGGFIITGNAPKKVLVRAIGPSINVNGVPVPGTLQDPVLELHDGTGKLLSSDDDWRATQEQLIIETTIPPTDPHESAILAILSPGNYTAIVSGKNNTSGIALVEIYDLGTASLDISSAAELANISTRGKVQTADDVMIGGFILGGNDPSTVLVRALGPELTDRGVTGALSDTVLELHDGTGAVVGSNDDWQSTQEAQIEAILPPTDARESAILATLPPGNYTAVVSGKGGATGVGLVEVYHIQ